MINQLNILIFIIIKKLKLKIIFLQKEVVDIILTSGASCPDAVVEAVLRKIHSFFPTAKNVDEVIDRFLIKQE